MILYVVGISIKTCTSDLLHTINGAAHKTERRLKVGNPAADNINVNP